MSVVEPRGGRRARCRGRGRASVRRTLTDLALTGRLCSCDARALRESKHCSPPLLALCLVPADTGFIEKMREAPRVCIRALGVYITRQLI